MIDDVNGVTMVSASTLSPELKDEKLSGNVESAKKVGELLAKKLKKPKIEAVVF
jgi:large subunit ribosomal protein L18